MKLLFLTKLNLKNIILKNKFIFVVFVITQVIIFSSLIYIIADVNTSDFQNSSYDDTLRTYVVRETETDKFTAEKLISAIESLKQNPDINDVVINIPVDENTDYAQNGIYNYGAVSYPLKEEEMFKSLDDFYDTKNFTSSEHDADNIIALCTSFNDYNYTDKSITLYNKDFRIIGAVDIYQTDKSIINFSSLLANDIPVESIYIRYNEISDASDMFSKTTYLQGLFENAIIELPANRDYALEEQMENKKILQYAMIILALIGLSYLFVYMLESQKKTAEIFFMCGCSEMKFVIVSLLSVLAISFIQLIIVFVLYFAVLEKVIVSIEPAMRFTLNAECYLRTFMTIAIETIIVFVPIVLNFLKKKNYNIKA